MTLLWQAAAPPNVEINLPKFALSGSKHWSANRFVRQSLYPPIVLSINRSIGVILGLTDYC